MQQLDNPAEARSLALAVLDAIVDPFILLDDEVRLVGASRSFYDTFKVDPEAAHGQIFYDLCGGVWDVPALRKLLAKVIPARSQVDGFELNIRFAELGDRTLLLNARVVAAQGKARSTVLVAMKDVTVRRKIEAEKQNLLEETEELLRRQRNLLKEMEHRVANSLQIIASILMLKARAVGSQEARDHLTDAHQRVMSVAGVQAHLHSVDGIDRIDGRAYLTKLCQGLAASMTGPANPIAIEAIVSEGTLGSARAVSLGLIVTELVINAIKYAFPVTMPDARVVVSYEKTEGVWCLKVSDNGVGNLDSQPGTVGGLGTAIVTALAKQLRGRISIVSDENGHAVSLTGTRRGTALPASA